MEDFLAVLSTLSKLQIELQATEKRFSEEVDEVLFGIKPDAAEAKPIEIAAVKPASSSITPQQTKKRPKRLTALSENDETPAPTDISERKSARMSNNQLLAIAQEEEKELVEESVEQTEQDEMNTTGTLMPPPPAPKAVAAAAETSLSSERPQRAAKLKSEKNLKEPSLSTKLRRPSANEEPIKVKLESEQRASQMHSANIIRAVQAEAAAPAEAEPDINPPEKLNSSKLRIVLKREKLSVESTAETTKTLADETNVLSSTANTTAANTTNTTATNTTTKKGRKKAQHRPIKVERFSELDKDSPISSRTRHNSCGSRKSQETQAPPQRSIYEDAVETTTPPVLANETITLHSAPINDAAFDMPVSNATFNMPISNATMTLGNATFQVEDNQAEKELSMETAREGSMPKTSQDSSLMTEDDSLLDSAKTKVEKPATAPKLPTSQKSYKLPARAHELFNPLLQSPVKMRVEAFENAANAQNNLRSKRIKDLTTPGSSTTPVIGKLGAPALGRFLTPTQSSNALPLNSAQPKKAPMSACKSTTLMKTATGTSLKSTVTGSSKTLSREHSGDDFRKGLHQLAEDRKKQREQKHLQAAQLREAKERERAERLAKLNKERSEKRLKKQQEKDKLEERKRMEMEELQRKIAHQEEIERLKKAKAKEQERELLQQMKQAKSKQMMPPQPKSKYTFEMLHEDDSTDDENKVSYKRPAVPSWSRSHVRVSAIAMQSHCPTDVIDSFFSVAPTTPDLKLIFPNIDPSHLKRNSSVMWSTPPRYSELPKY